MKKKLIYLILTLSVTLIVYEIYALALAYNSLSDKFSPYTSVSPIDIGLSKERLGILVKVQDPTFYTHSGVEWPSPLTTTTITQSLVKRLFFKKFSKGLKKIEQTLIARFVVNPNIDKDTQLTAFISTAYFGNRDGVQIFGFAQGANAWFKKALYELNDEEYLTLLAMLPAPNRIKPNTVESKERLKRLKLVLSGKCIFKHVSQINLGHCS